MGKQIPPVDGEEAKKGEKANFEPDHESTPLTVKGLGVLLGTNWFLRSVVFL